MGDGLVERALDVAARDRLRAGQIARIYRLALGRVADPDGLTAMIDAMRHGQSVDALISLTLASEEFARRARPAPGTAAEVDAMFEHAFGVPGPTLGEDVRALPPQAYMARLVEAAERAWPTRPTSILYADGLDPAQPALYRRWLNDHHIPDRSGRRAIRAAAARSPPGVAVSIVLLGDVGRPRGLADTLASLRAQLSDGWQLVAAGGDALCRQVADAEPDAATVLVDGGGWAEAFNAALAACEGALVMAVAPGTRLADDAVFHLATAEAAEGDSPAAALFTDHDLIDDEGRRFAPRFATGWDAEIAALALDGFPSICLRTDLARASGARGDYPGCEWDDLVLRVLGVADGGPVRHVPRPLISLPAETSSTAASDRGGAWRRLIADRLAGAAGADRPAPRLEGPANGGLPWLVHPLPRKRPLVSVIVPTRDRADLLATCLHGLLERTAYDQLEILVIDNRSRQPETLAFLDGFAGHPTVRVLAFDQPFNWGAINNFGVCASGGEVVALLNNDTAVLDPDWLTELVAQAMRPEVGAVGPLLLYPDGTIQHAGMIFGPDGQAFHRFRGVDARAAGYDRALRSVREVSAVTGACMVLRRAVFDEAGGIEQASLAVTWSDVDLCFRMREAGYRVIFTPFARLRHLELATRGADDTPERIARAERERDFMLSRWPRLWAEDPHYNVNLHLGEGETRLAAPPRAGFQAAFHAEVVSPTPSAPGPIRR